MLIVINEHVSIDLYRAYDETYRIRNGTSVISWVVRQVTFCHWMTRRFDDSVVWKLELILRYL